MISKISFLTFAKVVHLRKAETEFCQTVIELDKSGQLGPEEEERLFFFAEEFEDYKKEIKQDIEKDTGVPMDEGVYVDLESGELKRADEK